MSASDTTTAASRPSGRRSQPAWRPLSIAAADRRRADRDRLRDSARVCSTRASSATSCPPTGSSPTTLGFGGVWDVVHTDAEITPPLYFLLAKLTTQIAAHAGDAAAALADRRDRDDPAHLSARGADGWASEPALVGGGARHPQPLPHLLLDRGPGLCGDDRPAARLDPVRCCAPSRAGACAGGSPTPPSPARRCTRTTPSPSPSPRRRSGRSGRIPPARRAVLLANLGAALAFLPWLSGFDRRPQLSDHRTSSPLLQPFTWDGDPNLARAIGRIGYAYALIPLSELPGYLALVLIGARIRSRRGRLARRSGQRSGASSRLGSSASWSLILALALATPVGEALVSAVSTNLFGTRNLAAAWPGCALLGRARS